MEDVRNIMGAPEWMLSVDSRKITLLHNGACVQMLIHFKGPLAHHMELDLSRLIAGGRLETPTINIVGYAMPKRKKILAYRVCGVRDPNEKNGRRSRFGGSFTNKANSIMGQVNLINLFILPATVLIITQGFL